MNKLEKIVNLIAEYDAAEKEMNSVPHYHRIDDTEGIAQGDRVSNSYHKAKVAMITYSEEYLRTLLPVVEAASNLPVKIFGFSDDDGDCPVCGTSWGEATHNSDCTIKKFLDALTALQQPDSAS